MNREELRAGIQARGYGNDTETAQNTLILSVYRRINGFRRWPFLDVTGNTATAATIGTSSVSTAAITDLLFLNAVRLESGTEYLPLTYRTIEEFRPYEHLDRTNGTPLFWTDVNHSVHLWPTPDKAYTLSIDYTKRPADIDDDADEPIWDETYHDLLVWGPIVELCFRERDPAGRAMAIEEFNKRLSDMLHGYGVRQRQTSQQVRKSGFHQERDFRSGLWLTT